MATLIFHTKWPFIKNIYETIVKETQSGSVLCPAIVGHNIQSTGQVFFGDQFCADKINDYECSVNDVKKADKTLDRELEDFDIFKRIGSICIIFAIIATCTVIAGYFQVLI